MVALEQEILIAIRRLDETSQQRVLEFVRQISEKERTYTASELLDMPFEERELHVRAALEKSKHVDFEIFEAYSENDFYDYDESNSR